MKSISSVRATIVVAEKRKQNVCSLLSVVLYLSLLHELVGPLCVIRMSWSVGDKGDVSELIIGSNNLTRSADISCSFL